MKQMIKYWKPVFDNDNTALAPEVWAQEALMILENNMIMSNLVYRDFENEIATYGDTVNAHRPNSFVAQRKVDGVDVIVQDARATNVPVKLDQHLHVSFMIYDGEESKSFKDLVDLYLRPALIAEAQGLDQVVGGQVYDFLGNSVGQLGTPLSKSSVVAANEQLNKQKCPLAGRNMVVSPDAEGDLLDLGEFTKVNETGTPEGLVNANLGTKFNFKFFMDQNTPSVPTGSTVQAATVTNAAGVGATVIVLGGLSTYQPLVGSWITMVGDMTPQLILTASAVGAGASTITIAPGLKSPVVGSGSAAAIYVPGAVNYGPGYASGYNLPLVVDGFTVSPKLGQMISINGSNYSAMSTPTTTQLLLNRSLDNSAANNAVVGVGPAGNYSFGFHRNAVALVVRPLAAPRAGTGALSYVANYNGLSVRVTITYNGLKQGHLVTVDMLAGVKTLDTNLGVVMLS